MTAIRHHSARAILPRRDWPIECRKPSSPLIFSLPEMGFVGANRRALLSSPQISGVPEICCLLRKSGTPDLRWGGGGGVCAIISDFGAGTPILALPTRGREKGAWFPAMDSLPLRCAPAGNDTGVTLRVIPGERSEGRGSTHTRDGSFPPHKERGITS